MKKFMLVIAILVLSVSSASAGVLDTLKTPAEESDWTISTPSQEVVDFVKTVADNSGGRIRYEDMGYTVYGKPLPLAIVGIPSAPRNPSEVGDRIVIHIQCNIHSGEIEGKEASLLFLREIAQGQHDALLKDVVLLVNSNFNPDGNDTFGNWRINSQPTPTLVGTRTNAQGFNLNRDFVKLDSPEAKAHLKIFRKWGPSIIVDEHATDGTRHRHPIAYGYGNNPNNDQEFENANRLFAESLFGVGIGEYADPQANFFRIYMSGVLEGSPELADGGRPPRTESVRAIPYMESYGGANTFTTFINDEGKTERRPTRLTTGNGDGVRYTSNLPTLKNRIALLFECHSHNEYRYRVHTQYAATYSMIEQAAKQKDEILALIRNKDETASNRSALNPERDVIYLNTSGTVQSEYDLGYGPGLITVEGFAYAANTSGDRTSTTIDPTVDREWEDLEIWATFAPGVSTPMGALYVLDPAAQSSVELLLRHGVKVKRLTSDVTLSGTASDFVKFYNPENARGNWTVAKASGSGYEGHNNVTVSSGDWHPIASGSHVVTKGHYVISTAQPFGTFAAFMLEPKGNDGLCYWNFWDEQLFSTEQNGGGSFDIVKTYSYSAIPNSALEDIFLTEGAEGTDFGASPAAPFSLAELRDEAGAHADITLSQSGNFLTVNIPADSGLKNDETAWFWFNRVINGKTYVEGATARVISLNGDGTATLSFDRNDVDGEGNVLPDGKYSISYFGTLSYATGYSPYSRAEITSGTPDKPQDDVPDTANIISVEVNGSVVLVKYSDGTEERFDTNTNIVNISYTTGDEFEPLTTSNPDSLSFTAPAGTIIPAGTELVFTATEKIVPEARGAASYELRGTVEVRDGQTIISDLDVSSLPAGVYEITYESPEGSNPFYSGLLLPEYVRETDKPSSSSGCDSAPMLLAAFALVIPALAIRGRKRG
ncbi:MAG: hypothetical protein LBQ58_10285 [Synergistaceae bacterium]|jgi:hypothetical protein|nr:hypothetical protein [Synergistaceae bacterium]